MNKVVCIMGPTAVGKTALAVELAQHIPAEIISVDSALIYRDMNIGTAKPDATLLQQVPHYLIDIVSPTESYSAADFCRDAIVAIDQCFAQHKLPLLVGGTMLYFKALQQGLSPLPTADATIRATLQDLLSQQGLPALYHQLQRIDPKAAAQIKPQDTHRILRALEVYQATGVPLSVHWQITGESQPYDFINIALMPEDRAQLHHRIAERLELMLEQGFVDEVITLRAHYALSSNLPAMRTVGYRQVWQYLEGEYDYPTMVQRVRAATRQLAKRQMTWLRSWPNVTYFDPFQEHLMQHVLNIFIRL